MKIITESLDVYLINIKKDEILLDINYNEYYLSNQELLYFETREKCII